MSMVSYHQIVQYRTPLTSADGCVYGQPNQGFL